MSYNLLILAHGGFLLYPTLNPPIPTEVSNFIPATMSILIPATTVDRETIEAQLALAIIAAECTFGPARVRISAAYYLSKERPELVIDMSTEVGEHIAQVFAGLLTRQVGEEKFSVERVIRHEAVS